jgi:hypothetical protein
MPPPHTQPVRSSERLNGKGHKKKAHEKGHTADSPERVHSEQDDSDDNSDDDEVVITQTITNDTPKRKLNDTSSVDITTTKTFKVNPSNTFKVVNHESKNRRLCKRFGDELRSRTPDRNNLSSQKFTFTTRLTFRITLPSTKKPEESLVNIFSEFFHELKKIDEHSVIAPWRDVDKGKGNISKDSELPTSIKTLRTYLHKFYIGKKDNQPLTTYPSIHIGHNKRIPEIREELQFWLNAGKHGLFVKMLQVESSSEIGWLLYSTKAMDAGALVDEISELIGLQVGLRWKIIDTGAKGKLPEEQRIQALNVEVDTSHRWDAQKKLATYYGRAMKNLTDYPNGIRLRFVKSKRDAINTVEKGKIERLRARQKAFLANIQSSVTWDIVQLDYSSHENTPTLRQMIMSLTTIDGKIPLFHCVDLDWRGDGYTFQYSPQVKIEAECAIHTLLPLLQHHFPDVEVDDHFTSEVVERCSTFKFDAKTGTIVDEELGDHLAIIDDDNLLGFTFDIDATATPTKAHEEEARPSHPNVNKYFPTDNDSVSTFARNYDNDNTFQPITPSRTQARRLQRSLHDASSTTSATSTVTMETMQTFESKLSSLSHHVLDNNRKFDLIMAKLGIKELGGQGSPPDNEDCTPAAGHSKAGRDTSSSSGNVH